ncbi:MAG: hypothetical protein LBB59_04040 [Campylobacteraceae bacterium]|nr:hypothetical protein [Campylobacteraceae bacterium]
MKLIKISLVKKPKKSHETNFQITVSAALFGSLALADLFDKSRKAYKESDYEKAAEFKKRLR